MINMDDLTALINYLVYGHTDPFNAVNANVNQDNNVGMDDLTALISILVGL